MSRSAGVCVAVFVCSLSAVAQQTDVLPLPLVSPRSAEPGTLDRLTPEEKAARAIRNTFGWRAIANRALVAGINHWKDHPTEWPGDIEGYGMRYGSRMGRLAVRNAVTLATDVAFGIDSRYDRCDCTKFKSRTLHAVKRLVIARKDDGSQMFNVTRMAGAYVPPIITDQWYPDRLNTWGHHFSTGTSYLAWQAGTNMLREFWPDIRRKMPFKKQKP